LSVCYIDIIDKCNLRCSACPRGLRLLKNSTESMSIDLFKKVVEKAKAEGYDEIGIYNWTEPFLSKALPEYISVVKEFGLFCDVTSNLSLKPQEHFDTIEQSLVAGIDHLAVSVSGYGQAVYEVNHVGGNISWVKQNLERIAQLRRDGNISSARISLRFLKFDYNIEEESVLKEYANSLGLDFEVIDGMGHPNNPVTSYVSEEDSVILYNSEEDFLNKLKNFTPSRIYEKNREICFLIMDTVSIDCKGDVYLCCAYPNYSSLRIGAYLEIPKDDILLKRYTHPVCTSCPFPRRKATESDCKALVGALQSRLGNSNKLQDEYTQNIEPLPKSGAEVKFSKPKLPGYLSVSGLSIAESWGRWSNGDKVILKFGSKLPAKFSLTISAMAYGPNAGEPVIVKAGNQTKEYKFGADVTRSLTSDFFPSVPVDAIEILIPKPTPTPSPSRDTRRLGLGFSSLSLRAIP